MSEWPFGDLKRGHYGAIYADPPWRFAAWATFKTLDDGSKTRAVERYYKTMLASDLATLPVAEIAADDCALFLWVCWPNLTDAWQVIAGWGFEYKTCAFAWVKADGTQPDLFRDDIDAHVGMGYWTRANSEVCLLATRGSPKRLNADVRQGIIEPRRQHSRKPDCVPSRIERLVAGPYVELFARTRRSGWDAWGNEVGKFTALTPQEDAADSLASYNAAIMAIGERVKAGEKVPEFMLSRKALP